jgi:hypothetical protein
MIMLVHNERIKLLATAINNTALAFVIGGFVAPEISARPSAWSVVWIGVGAALHLAAQSVLGKLKA